MFILFGTNNQTTNKPFFFFKSGNDNKHGVKVQTPQSTTLFLVKVTSHTTLKPYQLQEHSSGAVWESRWPPWAVRPNEPSGIRGRKAILNHASALVSACPFFVNWHLRTLSNTTYIPTARAGHNHEAYSTPAASTLSAETGEQITDFCPSSQPFRFYHCEACHSHHEFPDQSSADRLTKP